MKVLLITSKFNKVNVRWMPLGMCYLAASLRERGHEVQIFDRFVMCNGSEADTMDAVLLEPACEGASRHAEHLGRLGLIATALGQGSKEPLSRHVVGLRARVGAALELRAPPGAGAAARPPELEGAPLEKRLAEVQTYRLRHD